MHDYAAAAAHITALTNQALVDFRCIHDTDKAVPAHHFRSTLAEIWPTLCDYQQRGYGVFININQLDGRGRELHNIAWVNAHVVDLDNLSAVVNYERAAAWQPAPTFAVQSSPGRYHAYWCVQPYAGNDRYNTVQRKLRQVFDGDASVIDPTRVLRLAGSYNFKRGGADLVTCWALGGMGQRYPVETLEAALSAVEVIDGGLGERHELGDPTLAAPSLAWLQRALDLVDPNNLDRSEWISFSAAIKQSGWTLADPDSLFAIWSKWCERYASNDPAENLKAWNSWRNTQLGWPSVAKRVPTLRLGEVAVYVPKAPSSAVAAPVGTPAIPEPLPLDCSGEFLTHLEQQEWFKGCVAIERTGEILVPTGRFMKPAQFNIRYGGKQFIITSGGKVTDEPWKAATRSTMWTVPKADHVRFLPSHGFGDIITDQLGRRGVNTYIPVQIKRVKGDPSPFLRHLEAMLPDANDRRILLDYMAHNIKYPGDKIPWAPMIQSTEGVGKGFIMEMLERILGEMYCYSPKAQELVKSGSTFNAWMRAKLLIIVNEIKVDERRELIEILKPMITDKRVEIQAKGIDQEMEDNCANWIFFSNFKDAIPVNQNGRRYAIFYSAIQSKHDLEVRQMTDSYFTALHHWMRHQDGSEIVADYLLEYPIERGAIPGKAPRTSSYNEALALSRGPIERAVADAVEDGLAGFRGGWISVQAVQRLMVDKSIRTVSAATLEGIVEAMGYKRMGRSVRCYLQEDRNGRSALFHLDGSAPVEWYGPQQGYE